MRIPKVFFLVMTAVACLFPARVKDVARLDGQSEMQLIGYGLVVGLRGTGDGPRTQFTTQSTINMLRNLGIEVPQSRIQLRNVAAVMVIGKISPYQKKGSKIDVTVSSMGDARSLEGGTLLMSPLQGPDGELHAMAQGALSVGGVAFQASRSSYKKNHVLAGEIPGGAIIQKEIAAGAVPNEELFLALRHPDIGSAVNMAAALNAQFGSALAEAVDPVTVRVRVPPDRKDSPMGFIAEVENVEFAMAGISRVVLNEKTGTVIAGGGVTIAEVAVAHGGITVEVQQNQQIQVQGVVAPGRAAQQTVQNNTESMTVDEPKTEMRVLPRSTSVAEISRSLNALGVSPRDIIAIFQAIHKAGALNAELVVM